MLTVVADKSQLMRLNVEFVGLGDDGTVVVCGVPLKRKPLAKLRQRPKRL